MLEIPVHNPDGKQVGSMQVDEALLGGEVRPGLLKQAYVMYHANRRSGTATTKGRADKAGSTRKMYRQKGTGNARRGNIRTNLLRGGGVTFAKKPKSWRQSMPIKMRRLATRNALLAKAVDNEIKVIQSFSFAQPKTKAFAEVLKALSIDRTCLLAVPAEDQVTSLSARNIQDVTTIQIDQLNAYDLLSRRFLLVEQEVLQKYLDGLKAPAGDVKGAA